MCVCCVCVAQVPALKPLVNRFPYLDEYLEQIFSHNTDWFAGAGGEEEDYESAFRRQQTKVKSLGPAGEAPSDNGAGGDREGERKREGEGPQQGERGDDEALPFLTYLCFDTTIIGSELIVALGFLQGLLLKSLGTIGWSNSEQFVVQVRVPRSPSTHTHTLSLSLFLLHPLSETERKEPRKMRKKTPNDGI